ncbi:hypothetical protein CPC08DRAFT_769881 [Agrocybe pediades]|nr:hypothetical protein CPC08DRAFT_769881 [Agrocybe pediades]
MGNLFLLALRDMYSTDDVPYSVAQQKAKIGADLNSTMVYQFLFGMYTGLFPASVYIYAKRGNRTRSRDWIIIGNITALYTRAAVYLSINWVYTNILFCTKGSTRVEMFIVSLTGDMPLGLRIAGDVQGLGAFMFADGLLVWRCFHACGRSLRRSLLPIALFIVETVLVVSSMICISTLDATRNFRSLKAPPTLLYNHLVAATLISVAATSLVSAVIVCLQIWRHTTAGSRSRRHYRKTTSALIESSATYSVAVLFQATLQINTKGKFGSSFTVLLISSFVDGISNIIYGLAPTLMIVRLFAPANQEETEVSSLRLPSDLISAATNLTGANSENTQQSFDMQQNLGVAEDEEIRSGTRAESHSEV